MRSLAAITAAALLAALPPAFADPIPAKARRLAAHGREMHERGEYDRAITAFKEAYVLAPSPGLLFNLAQAYRLQGNCDDAQLMYQRYLATSPAPAARTLAEAHLATVERCIHKRALNIPLEDALAYLNVPPPPGPERVIEEDRRAIARPSDLEKTIGIGLTVAGGAALVTAPHVERTKLLGIGGGLAVAGGVVLWVIGWHEDRMTALAVTPAAGGAGAHASYAWRF